eukprot:CAMPEP_0180396442 /NCGR_PEP_ID=MMETSP0989-20121125/35442_1 /TAXON_ID=697907 /ORGANISM="non described non described, Strain CCMP2293" /LENGTH=36 /DNA_ID= /DNA_START= /DNA_END= /DNA_ORIENTATION=
MAKTTLPSVCSTPLPTELPAALKTFMAENGVDDAVY